MPSLIGSDDISFKERATADQAKPRNDPEYRCSEILVDTGSSADIIFKNTLERMGIRLSEIVETPSPLVRLSGKATMTLGSINLAVKAESITKVVEFLVIDFPASYNAIAGTPWINSMQAVPSTFHMCLKFPSPHGIETIWGDRRISQVCFSAELKRKKFTSRKFSQKEKNPSLVDDALEQDKTEIFRETRRAEALEEKRKPTCEPVVSVCLDEAFPERCVEIGANLCKPLKTKLITCLKKNFHTFAWAEEDMPGTDINITYHELNIDPTFKPVKQKRQNIGPERAASVNKEVEKLLKLGSITMESGESASISLTLIKPARKTAFHYRTSIVKRRLETSSCLSWTFSRVTIRS